MNLILAAETPYNRYMIALSIPRYQPSRLLGVIVALLLALGGLAIDVLLFPAVPVGAVALLSATIAAGIVLGLLGLEVMHYETN